jgi:hypothetical protein
MHCATRLDHCMIVSSCKQSSIQFLQADLHCLFIAAACSMSLASCHSSMSLASCHSMEAKCLKPATDLPLVKFPSQMLSSCLQLMSNACKHVIWPAGECCCCQSVQAHTWHAPCNRLAMIELAASDKELSDMQNMYDMVRA